jgi:hypothetical protein
LFTIKGSGESVRLEICFRPVNDCGSNIDGIKTSKNEMPLTPLARGTKEN